jgi:phytoene dehydrogenase-like protein
MSEAQYDIVVAGGGHNSLVAAAYLGKAGFRCLVLEHRSVIGGNTVTEELTLPGFLHDTCSTAHNIFQSSPIMLGDELGLERHGLRYIKPDPVIHMPFADGTSLTQWQDIARTTAEFARFSKKDAEAFRRVIDEYNEVGAIFGETSYTPIGFGPSLAERLAKHPKGAIWQRRIALSAWENIRTRFEHPNVRAFLLWMAFMTMVPPDQPGSGRLAYSLLAGRQRWSWSIPEGGSGRLSQALAAVVREQGGELLTDKTVTGLIVEDGVCRGVTCGDGSSYRAGKAVLSTIHFKHLVEMAPPEVWGETLVESADTWQPGVGMFASHYATNAPIEVAGPDGPILPSAIGVMPSVDHALRIGFDMARGAVETADPALLVICSSAADPSRAPAGHHTLKVVGFAPYELAEGPQHWDAIKEEVARANLRQFKRYVPSFSEGSLMKGVVNSPLDLERTNPHNWHGSCHGGAQTPGQSGPLRPAQGWAQHRMPIRDLYQTGSTTYPGGSVSGAPGRNAAMVMLKDFGTSLEAVLAR